MIAAILRRFSVFTYSTIISVIITCSIPLAEPLMAQNENLETIITSFENYTSQYRELAYCHLNKSTYIKGEMIGFSAYVFDKDLKVPSKSTKNLYCVITDKNNELVKSKLIRVENGFSNTIFKIDSAFTSGNYTIKAYTNWMNNFEEPNAFVESFRVIDPEVKKIIKKRTLANEIDAQFLPEGGYFVDAVQTTVGVILKNTEGLGISEVEGNVYDSNNKFITAFKTNSLGIGRFLLYPELNQKYKVKINHLNKDFEFQINDIKPKGISINLNNYNKKLAIGFNTNERTYNDIKSKWFNLIIHNGNEAKGIYVTFNEKDIVKMIDHEELFPGINIFTLFDENNQPLLERLFFNYEGVNLLSYEKANYTQSNDSLQISIPIKEFAHITDENSNISISVLPEGTKSYKRHQNIISYTFLQPYVKGYIENAQYYFTNINSKKKYDLDNLLITQGWSSYAWGDIFNKNVSDNYVFEDGILLKANQNKKRQSDFIVYPLKYSNGLTVNLTDEKQSFVVPYLYPEGNEVLGIGKLNKRGKVNQPDLSMQFFPSKIPDYNNQPKVLKTKRATNTKTIPKSPLPSFNSKEAEILDEVLVEADPKLEKINRLRENLFLSNVDVFDDHMRQSNLTFVMYLNRYVPGFNAFEQAGKVFIGNRRVTSSNDFFSTPTPIVYLDDMLITNLDYFYAYNMFDVDYVTVNNGLGEGFLGANGVIKIYTNPGYAKRQKDSVFKSFKFPLTFSEKKKFYAPKYDIYNDDFFRNYGVIDWIPNCKIDTKRHLNFTIYNPANNNMTFFIEGVTENGVFTSELKTLNINDNN
ncbi:hypothetical protein [Winogradskyella sp. R77965]|uniref:hypothetical protein n=1 Tax=Winogradskyella sp. R77965 TaxID=3093872 RepID=UPI0037DCE26A